MIFLEDPSSPTDIASPTPSTDGNSRVINHWRNRTTYVCHSHRHHYHHAIIIMREFLITDEDDDKLLYWLIYYSVDIMTTVENVCPPSLIQIFLLSQTIDLVDFRRRHH